MPFTIDNAKAAILQLAQEKGKDRAELIEKMMRCETAHFASKQYQATGSAGMEDGLWGDKVKKYMPNGYTTVPFVDNNPKRRGTDKPLNFIVWDSVYHFCLFLSDYIDRFNGNYARWNSTNPVYQKDYEDRVQGVIARFV